MKEKKNIAVYPGTFDPPTYGHLDIIKRASSIFDKVIISISADSVKNTTFSIKEREEMLRVITRELKNVEVTSFKGLLVNFLKNKKSRIIIRGLRAVSDFEYEFQLALTNRKLDNSIETVFFIPDETYTYLSSSLVKEIIRLNGNIDKLVPPIVKFYLEKKLKKTLDNYN
jgi:pantetheine-phosphate adenylyltransferase